jgi:putative ABC transport system permease protein
MSHYQPRPSRVLLWLLRQVSSVHAASAAVGDILEELEERRAAGQSPRWPMLWLNLQILGSVAASFATVAPRFLRSVGHTLRDAVRALRRAPAHALFILLILGVGIAAATVTFSVVDAVVLRPLPFDRSEELVVLNPRNLRGPTAFTPQEFWTIHDRIAGFESLGLRFTWFGSPVTARGVTEELPVRHATAEVFRVLRLQALVGRLWTGDDETRDPHVAVIGYGFWQRRFGGDPAVLGEWVRIQDTDYRIVGVVPDAAEARRAPAALWVPGGPDRVGAAATTRTVRGVVGRIRSGVSVPQLTAAIQSAITPPADASSQGLQVEVQRWLDAEVKDVRGWMLLLLGSVVLVMLIACVNAANMVLTRSSERARELAVRASLGASGRQLALAVLAESVMLSLGAGLCAVIFAAWGAGAAKAFLPPALRADSISLNGRVFAVSIVAALATGILFGLVPAWQASRVSVVTLLKDAGTTTTAGRRAWRSGFLIAEVACVAVLLVVSTLFIASFIRAITLDLGVDRSNLLAVSPHTDFNGTVDEVQSRLKQIPAVVDVAVVTYSSLPLVAPAFGGAYGDTKIRTADDDAGHATVEVQVYRVTPNYFDVTGMVFRRGSTWAAAAALESPPVVLDEIAAKRLFGDRDPIGRPVASDDPKGVFTVVGVVPYVYSRGPQDGARPSAYLPIVPDATRRFAGLFVRTSAPPDGLVAVVETALRPLAPSSRLPYVHLVDEALSRLTAARRFNATLMSLFALFAILIGAAGIYAVMASVVAQQTREFGVRVALGATAADIRHGVLAQAGRHLLLGLALGLPAAWWISRAFGALLFQVRPSDVSIYIVVAVTLTLVGLIAAVVPARRASRVDPIVSLRAT